MLLRPDGSAPSGLATIPPIISVDDHVNALTGLQRDSVANVTAIVTLNKDELGPAVGTVPESLMRDLGWGLRQVLAL
jgi:mRNA-degrading endonuclease toxin of MazEF toxin-antitoxin module